jgi:ribose transport system substrate-binding protein
MGCVVDGAGRRLGSVTQGSLGVFVNEGVRVLRFGTGIAVRRRAAVACVALALGAVAVGCGSEQSTTGETGTPSAADPALTDIRAKVDRWLSDTGTYQAPPTGGPKAEPGKTIALISCTYTCERPIASAQEAAKVLGWKTTLFNAKNDPSAAATGIRNAIAAKADGIFVYYLDCKYIRSALVEAKQAKIPVVAAISLDCDDEGSGSESLFTHVVTYVEGDFIDFSRAWGEAGADYAITRLDGKANLLMVTDDTAKSSVELADAAEAEFKKCSACKFYPEYFPAAAFDTGLREIVSQALLKHPDTNVVMVGYEAVLGAGAEAAVEGSGKELLFGVGEGGESSMEALRSYDGAAYGTGYDIGWEAWAAMDAFVRLFAGQEPVASGIGIQLYAKQADGTETNVPASGRYVPPFDYAELYTEAWKAAK